MTIIKETKDEQGILHSFNDEPALITNNYKVWYEAGVIHREDGPALLRSDGGKSWNI